MQGRELAVDQEWKMKNAKLKCKVKMQIFQKYRALWIHERSEGGWLYWLAIT